MAFRTVLGYSTAWHEDQMEQAKVTHNNPWTGHAAHSSQHLAWERSWVCFPELKNKVKGLEANPRKRKG